MKRTVPSLDEGVGCTPLFEEICNAGVVHLRPRGPIRIFQRLLEMIDSMYDSHGPHFTTILP